VPATINVYLLVGLFVKKTLFSESFINILVKNLGCRNAIVLQLITVVHHYRCTNSIIIVYV
jgi:hypothetical protein